MTKAEEDPRKVYADIINLPRWEPATRPRMGREERAAQFSPYAALAGYGGMVEEEGRETEAWHEAGDDEQAELDMRLAETESLLERGVHPICKIMYFEPDERKAGGRTAVVRKAVRRIDTARRTVILEKRAGISGAREEIALDRIIRILPEED